MGLISAEDAAHAATRHVLSRSLGSGLFVAADVAENQVVAGDVLLLCSDGPHGSVTAQEMARAFSETDTLVDAAEKLLELANQRDGSDNISVQLIRVRSVERMGICRGTPHSGHGRDASQCRLSCSFITSSCRRVINFSADASFNPTSPADLHAPASTSPISADSTPAVSPFNLRNRHSTSLCFR
jgi:hypothetical protein